MGGAPASRFTVSTVTGQCTLGDDAQSSLSMGRKQRCGFLVMRESGSPWSLLLLFLGSKPRVRSIRFAAGHDAEGSQSHVHFDEKLHDSVVMVTQESDNSFLVKVRELSPVTSLLPLPWLLAVLSI